MNKLDLVGCAEIAKLCQVSRQVISNWRVRRKNWPEPACELECGPVWERQPMIEYLKQEGVYREQTKSKRHLVSALQQTRGRPQPVRVGESGDDYVVRGGTRSRSE